MRIEPQSRTDTLKQMRGITWRGLLVVIWLLALSLYALMTVLFPNLPNVWAAIIACVISISSVSLIWHHSQSSPDPYRSHYISTENGYLQIKGLSNSDILEAKFRISELKSITLGRRRLMGTLNPMVRAIDAPALTIEEANGNSVTFEGVGWTYNNTELQKLIATVAQQIGKALPDL